MPLCYFAMLYLDEYLLCIASHPPVPRLSGELFSGIGRQMLHLTGVPCSIALLHLCRA
jgi:hypothetical protein